ncbi:uncharacterized protein LOC120508385 [Passer montanus]|uniref:uncharacterized protein LOC120508385 n=1 Tax=Passer montanus TaxID=9160 RepID=UPI0019608EF9|nr:uncharacterized protein LOC120508385 [Passer montanus]
MFGTCWRISCEPTPSSHQPRGSRSPGNFICFVSTFSFSLSPVFALQDVCVFARCNRAAELCSCCVPEHGEGTVGTGSVEVSCPVLSCPGLLRAVPAAITVLGTAAVLLGAAACPVLAVVVADGDSRGEEGENVRSDVLQSRLCCAAQHAQEPQTAPCTLLCQGVRVVWGTLTTRILQEPLLCLTCGILVCDAPAEPGSFSCCVAKRERGGSRQVHSRVYSPWLSVNQTRMAQEQQTPVRGDVLYLLEPRLGSLARQGLLWRFAPLKDWPRCLTGVSPGAGECAEPHMARQSWLRLLNCLGSVP